MAIKFLLSQGECVISLDEASDEEQNIVFDFLLGQEVFITALRCDEVITLEGVLVRKGLYLGAIFYELKHPHNPLPIQVNLLYNIREVKFSINSSSHFGVSVSNQGVNVSN